jgi:hypothetical protein
LFMALIHAREVAMPKPQGRCIFCTGAGLTKEHVFPDWLNGMLPKRRYNKLERFRAFDPSNEAEPLVSETAKVHQGGPANRKVRVVCSGCNSGWMGRLQDRSKPILEPLIRGQTCVVGVYGQLTVATWVAMTATTAEFIQRAAPPAIQPQDRHHLWRRLAPPDHWQIWMGHYGGIDKELSYAQVRFELSKSGESPVKFKDVPTVNTQTTSIILGKLYLYLFSSAIQGPWPLLLSGEISAKLHSIWPLSGSDIRWPPQSSLTDHDVVSLKTALLERLGLSSHG